MTRIGRLRHRKAGTRFGRSGRRPRVLPRTPPPTGSRRQAWFVLVAITVVAVYGVFRILVPFLHAIIFALLLASLFGPLHRWLSKKLPGRPNVAAFMSVVAVFVAVVVPVVLFLGALVQQGFDTVRGINDWLLAGGLERVLQHPRVDAVLEHPFAVQVRDWLSARYATEAEAGTADVQSQLGADLTKALMQSGKAAVAAGKRLLPVVSATGSAVISFFIMLFVMFYAFRDGAAALAYVRHLSPLRASQEEALLARVRDVTRAVLLGTFLTAIAQGVAAMIGFRIVGIPALFWGSMLGAASVVPVIGTGLIWVPATLYLLLTGHPWSALFLFLWSALIVGSIDNFLRPLLMGGRTGMSSVVVFFALLGGIRLFGPVGIVYGPLIFGLCAVCLYIYNLENQAVLEVQDRR